MDWARLGKALKVSTCFSIVFLGAVFLWIVLMFLLAQIWVAAPYVAQLILLWAGITFIEYKFQS